MNQWFEEIDHTADLALLVRGQTFSQLLKNASIAMLTSLEIKDTDGKAEMKKIALREENRETLLVSWLEELLYIIDTEGLTYRSEELNLEIAGTYELSASFLVRSIEEIKKQIKAVTFHNLLIKESDAGLETIIVFDI